MKKCKYMFLIITFLVLVCFAMYFAYLRFDSIPYDPESLDTYYDENNIIFEWEAKKLCEGMTYGEVIGIIGKANRDIGSGAMVVEYDCVGGKRLGLSFWCDEHGNRVLKGMGFSDSP